MIPDVDLAYAAGLIDGEGSIGLAREKKATVTRRPSHRPWLSVGMTVEEPVRWLHKTFGRGSVHYIDPKPPRKGKWVWRVNGYGVREIGTLLLPYFKVKSMQAYLVVCFYEEGLHRATHGKPVPWDEVERREAIRDELAALNARGYYE